MDLARMDDAEVINMKNNFRELFAAAKATSDSEKTVKSQYWADYICCADEARRRAELKKTTDDDTTLTPLENIALKDMRTYVTESVDMFGPGVPHTQFINALENGYKMHVEKAQKLETSFVRQAKTKMSQSYLNIINETEEQTATWAQFKTYIKKTFGSKQTIYQALDRPFGITLDGNIADFGVAVQHEMDQARMCVQDIFEAEKKTVDVNSVFDLVGAQIVLRSLRAKRPDVFNCIVTSLDGAFTISDVVSKVKSFMDRAEVSDDLGQGPTGAFWSDRSRGGRGGGRGRGRGGGGRGRGGNRGGNTGGNNQPNDKNPTQTGSSERRGRVCYNSRDYGYCNRTQCRWDDCKGPKPNQNQNANTGFWSEPGFPQ